LHGRGRRHRVAIWSGGEASKAATEECTEVSAAKSQQFFTICQL